MTPDSARRDTPWYFDPLLILVCAGIAVWIACLPQAGIHFDHRYVPQSNDSFYHATRIMATYRDPDNFFQWDEDSFYPGGAFDAWPWFYDHTLANLLRLVSPAQPVKFLDYFPPAWILVNAILLLLICRELDLAWPGRLLALACFAISPLTQMLHMVGRIDHHYMEYTMVLGTLAGMLGWVNRPHSVRHAMIAGYFPGLAVGINPGLFALQVPFLASLFIAWVRGKAMPQRSSAWAAATLVIVTLLMTLPSLPAQVGIFSYDLLSWFHVYIAVCTAALMLLFSRLSFRPWLLPALAVAGIVLSYPLLGLVVSGIVFLKAHGPLLAIGETRSFFEAPEYFFRVETGLLLFVPLTIIGSAIAIFRSQRKAMTVLASFSIFGLLLLLTQVRLNYFGSFALYIPPLLMLQYFLRNRPALWRATGWSMAAAIALLANINTPAQVSPAANVARALPVQAFRILSEACSKQPATVLAPVSLGHAVRYITGCRTMANAMQGIALVQTNKAQHVRELLSLPPEKLREAADDFDYVLQESAVATYGSRYDDPFPGTIHYYVKDRLPTGFTRLSLETDTRGARVLLPGNGLFDKLVLHALSPWQYIYFHRQFVLLKINKKPNTQQDNNAAQGTP